MMRMNLPDSLAIQSKHSLEDFEAKLKSIFATSKIPARERNTHTVFLNNFTLFDAYNLVYSVIEQIEKFRMDDDTHALYMNDTPALYIEPDRLGKPLVKENCRSKTMNEIIDFYQLVLSKSKLANMSVSYLTSDIIWIENAVTKIPYLTIGEFYNMFQYLTDLKKRFDYVTAIHTRLGDIASPFEWNGL